MHRSSAATRRTALWLLIALLPMLSFAGHWPTHVDIPGTGYYLALPFSSQAHSHDSSQDHGRHCHANSASCSDVPAPVGLGFALLNETLALLGVAGLMVAVAVQSRRAPRGCDYAPEPGPPRNVLSLA